MAPNPSVYTNVYRLPALNEEGLQTWCAPFLKMSEAELRGLIPPQGGFRFSSCPNCKQGGEENQLTWNLELGDKVQCKFCKVTLPSAAYPENGQTTIPTPTGKQQVFKYFQNKDGKKFWLESRRWYEQRELLERAAYHLVQLYRADPVKHLEAGRRAALILKVFTANFPDYIIHYDAPGREKKFFTAGEDLTDFSKLPEGAYSASKWSWWAYSDISRYLLLTYDALNGSGLLTDLERRVIVRDLFEPMLDLVEKYDAAPATNMHPYLWGSQLMGARIVNRPALIEHIVGKMQRLARDYFTYDGFWHEGTPSYHLQTAIGIGESLKLIRPDLSEAEANTWLAKEYPDIKRAVESVDAFQLPNGFYAAVHEAHAEQSYSPAITKSQPILLAGMGYGILGFGENDRQLQAHLNFSGRFGHEHYDSLNLILFAQGQELVSDVGYNRTKARTWTMASAAHNTVLIDQQNQARGEAPEFARGQLRLFNATDPDFQIIEAETPGAYPGIAKTYRRTLVAVKAPDATQYVVDIFDVTGGSRHDWILHGNADDQQDLQLADAGRRAALTLQPASLQPAGFKFTPPIASGGYELIHDGPWAYGHFRDVQSITTRNGIVATFRSTTDPQNGLQTWIPSDRESTYYTAKSWSTRRTGGPWVEDESKLDDRLRSSLIVERKGESNRFIAVHVPLRDAANVQRVSQLPLSENGVAIKIEQTAGTDYLLFGPDAKMRSGNDGDNKLVFDGRVALAHLGNDRPGLKMVAGLKMVGGTQLQVGQQRLDGQAMPPAQLLSIEGKNLRVAGVFPVKPGEVIFIQHGDTRRTALHAEKVRQDGRNTIIETREPPIFSGEANGRLKMTFFPHLEFPAPHLVSANPLYRK